MILHALHEGRLPPQVALELARLARPEMLNAEPAKHIRKAEFEIRCHLRSGNGPHLARAAARILLAMANESGSD